MAAKHWIPEALRGLAESLAPVPHEINEIDWKARLSDNSARLAEHLMAFANPMTKPDTFDQIQIALLPHAGGCGHVGATLITGGVAGPEVWAAAHAVRFGLRSVVYHADGVRTDSHGKPGHWAPEQLKATAHTRDQQIADDLGISIKTVEAHRANIMEKLNANTVADLLKIALGATAAAAAKA